MQDPSIVDIVASAAAYRKLHRGWRQHLDRETLRLASLSPGALVADVPYLSLAAAERLAIPSVALCSLNWLDIYRAYCCPGHDELIVRTIAAAYRSAKLFLQPRPHMPMTDLCNRRSVGPITRIGRLRKEELRKALGTARNERLVLVTFGGIRSKRRIQLPSIAGVHWLVGPDQVGATGHATDVSKLHLSFIDLLASCDVVVTKVGYCTFVEAACNGVGLVSTRRVDWPESAGLIAWAKQNANFALVDERIENALNLRAALSAVLEAPRKPSVAPSGVDEAVNIIANIAGLR